MNLEDDANSVPMHPVAGPGRRKVDHLLGRRFARKLIARICGCAAESIEFSCTNLGKPYITAPRNATHLHFNISHSGGLVACAIAEMPVGIDIEVDRQLDYMAIARRCLSRNEMDWMIAGTRPQRRFFALWTLKEAFVKARGIGLGVNLTAITVSAIRGKTVSYVSTELDNCEGVRGYVTTVARNYYLSVCATKPPNIGPQIFGRWPDLGTSHAAGSNG